MAVDTKPPFTSVKRDAENFPRNENMKGGGKYDTHLP